MPGRDETVREDVSIDSVPGRSQPPMALQPHDAARFGRSSPVLRHWLEHSEGFRVRARRGSGVVLRVYGLPGAPRTVAVRTRLGGRRLLLPVDAFDEVVPEQRLLTVGTSLRLAARGERRRRPRITGRIARAAGLAGAALAVQAARAGRGAGSSLAWTIRRLGLLGARALRAGGRLLGRFVLMVAGMVRDAGLTLVELARVSRPRLGRGLVRGANHARAAANVVARRASRAGVRLSKQAREALRRRSREREEPPRLAERASE